MPLLARWALFVAILGGWIGCVLGWNPMMERHEALVMEKWKAAPLPAAWEPVRLTSEHRFLFRSEGEFEAAQSKQFAEIRAIRELIPMPVGVLIKHIAMGILVSEMLFFCAAFFWQALVRPTCGSLWRWALARREDLR